MVRLLQVLLILPIGQAFTLQSFRVLTRSLHQVLGNDHTLTKPCFASSTSTEISDRLAASTYPTEAALSYVTFVFGSAPSGYGKTSPEPNPSWRKVAQQLAKRLPNFGQSTDQTTENVATIATRTFSVDELETRSFVDSPTDIVVALGIAQDDGYARLCDALDTAVSSKSLKAFFCDPTCAPIVSERRFAGSFHATPKGPIESLQSQLSPPWSQLASDRRLLEKADLLLDRKSSEDYLFAVLFGLHALATPIDVVKSDINPSWEKGPIRNIQEFVTMCECCAPEIQAALTDPQSKEAIDQLNALDLRDQVGSYRVIVSNETPQLEEFTLCILQQNNCFQCDSPILTRPEVPLLTEWPQGQALDAKKAQQILIGHLDHPAAHPTHSQRKQWSWKIVVGANPAYDAFPLQHQIFYPTESKKNENGEIKYGKGLWYDPVFGVETLQGDLVWCKRHYRCVPRKHWSDTTVGAWTLTTLDNGMVSEEHWTTVAAADDLSWAVLHYSGAARRAGQSYVGALLCTPDGKWPLKAQDPSSHDYKQISEAFKRCDLELWELFGGSTKESFLWAQSFQDWAEENPPPLNRIGDISITAWRKQQRELERTKNTIPPSS